MTQRTIVEIDGKKIDSARAFHTELQIALDLGPYYGKNLNALWDVLSTGVGDNITLEWKFSDMSRAAFPDDFDKIIDIMRKAVSADIANGIADHFDFKLC